MRASNLLSGAQRVSEVSLFWKEIKSGAGLTTFEVQRQSAVRIRSTTAGLTVSFDGLLSATMDSGEVMVFNSGLGQFHGKRAETKETVTLLVSGNCFIQVGVEVAADAYPE
jgi:hypothetical protein